MKYNAFSIFIFDLMDKHYTYLFLLIMVLFVLAVGIVGIILRLYSSLENTKQRK